MLPGSKASRMSYIVREMAGRAVAVTRVSFGRVAANVLATGCPPGKRVIRIRGGRERADLLTAQAGFLRRRLMRPTTAGNPSSRNSVWSGSGPQDARVRLWAA